jgi:hypothetical protein
MYKQTSQDLIGRLKRLEQVSSSASRLQIFTEIEQIPGFFQLKAQTAANTSR